MRVKQLTRRDLAAFIGIGAVLGPPILSMPSIGISQVPGRIGIAKSKGHDGIDRERARSLMDRALVASTAGAKTSVEAVRSIFESSDTIGIKVNCLAAPNLSPHVELVEAFVDILLEVGFLGSKIIVFERSSSELKRAGFSIRKSGGNYLCYGTDNAYERSVTVEGEIGSCFSRIAMSCDALVSFGVVKDHDLAGVSAGLKNWYGVIHNPNKYHDNNCDPYVADIVSYLRPKLKLTILDGLRAQYHGGPAFNASALWPLGCVAASTDPVAADLWAWKEIDKERSLRGLPSLEAAGRRPKFIETAANRGLGVGDFSTLVEISA